MGYYRLAAYVYPFREPLPPSQPRQSPTQFRSDVLRPGVTFEDVLDLWMFDRHLRLLLLDALETVEVSLRTKVAYVLGAKDPFGHVNRSVLDPTACGKWISSEGAEAFDVWLRRYESLKSGAQHEDFVRHLLSKYGDPLPVWVIVEFLDFGALARLLGLMRTADQNLVASAHGLPAGSGRTFHKWVVALSYLRNKCAHHARLWNRRLTSKFPKWAPGGGPPLLAHCADSARRDVTYIPLAVANYLVRQIDSGSSWPGEIREHVEGFPTTRWTAVSSGMGFPAHWDQLSLWQ